MSLDRPQVNTSGSHVASGIEAYISNFTTPGPSGDFASSVTVEAADRKARHWTFAETGELRAGSDRHKRAICAMFHETFNPYRPSVMVWPTLTPEELRRLKSLPIWDIAVQTEGRARLHFAAYARSLADPDMHATVMLNAWEENRHREVLSNLVAAYGIPLKEEPEFRPPRDPEWAFLVTGYSESIDSFFAFGLFDLARRSGFFPMELVGTFEPVIQEECRHILFFANWLSWHRANLRWYRRIRFEFRVVAVWAYIAWLRIGMARMMDAPDSATHQDSNFTINGARAVTPVKVGFHELMQLCLRENDRRFAGYDSRLSRPTTIPALVRFVLRVGKFWTGLRGRRSSQSGLP
jgi:hypothetical protein